MYLLSALAQLPNKQSEFSNMSEDIVIRVLLLPIALLYGIGVGIRNLLYKMGVLRSVKFSLPVISVGNLTVGGAGKTPHIEYLLRWLGDYLNVATLSRGYGRQTEGFRQVTALDDAKSVGDEPLQFKRKFPEAVITVSESRALGVPELVKRNPETQCVLLDDAFQHLAVTPGLNILLTEYARPYSRDWLLPAGRLREWRSSARRADIIVVTKCPPTLTPRQRQDIITEINPFPRQKVYFSYYAYGQPYELLRPDIKQELNPDTAVLLVCAIAGTDYLLKYLGGIAGGVQTLEFEDHRFFTEEDLRLMTKRFAAMPAKNKIILTTEKDATRLELHRDYLWNNGLPVFVLPVEVAFHGEDETLFRENVQQFLMDFKR